MKTIVSIFGIVGVLVLASLGHSAETFKIAGIGAKTGDAMQSYANFLPAMRFAVDEINQHGGVLGKQIEIPFKVQENSLLGRHRISGEVVFTAVSKDNWSLKTYQKFYSEFISQRNQKK